MASESVQRVQHCTNEWLRHGRWREGPVSPGRIGSSARYTTCTHYSGEAVSPKAHCQEAVWSVNGSHDRARCPWREQSASFSAEMSPAGNRSIWLHFMGDSSLRLFFGAFVSHVTPTEKDPSIPAHDFCYQRHRGIDGCNEFDSFKGATKPLRICERHVPRYSQVRADGFPPCC